MSEKFAAEVHCRLARISSEIVSVTPGNALLWLSCMDIQKRKLFATCFACFVDFSVYLRYMSMMGNVYIQKFGLNMALYKFVAHSRIKFWKRKYIEKKDMVFCA